MSKNVIEGSPYSAQFVGQEDHTQGHSYAYALIQPPFVADAETYKLAFEGPTVITPLVTTQSKVLLEIDVPEQEREISHEAKLDIARHGLAKLIGYLNEIENGTFKHY